MPIVPAKCTHCGANLEVDSKNDAAICKYCETPFIIEKAINKYNIESVPITAQTVNIYGVTSDFIIRGGVLEKYNGQSVDVVVPDMVVDIAMDAFSGCQIRSIVIPGSIKKLTARMAVTLENVVFSEGLELIGDNVFYGCGYLKDINFPNSLKTIGASAFYNCTSFKSVHLPKGVTFSGWQAFWYCSNLTDVKAKHLQQFLETPWGTPIENDLIAYLRNIIDERKFKKLCPYCGSKIKRYLKHCEFYHSCEGCDFEPNFKVYDAYNSYYGNIESLKTQPLTPAIGNIAAGNTQYTNSSKEKAFAKLVIDYLAKRGLQW